MADAKLTKLKKKTNLKLKKKITKGTFQQFGVKCTEEYLIINYEKNIFHFSKNQFAINFYENKMQQNSMLVFSNDSD